MAQRFPRLRRRGRGCFLSVCGQWRGAVRPQPAPLLDTHAALGSTELRVIGAHFLIP